MQVRPGPFSVSPVDTYRLILSVPHLSHTCCWAQLFVQNTLCTLRRRTWSPFSRSCAAQCSFIAQRQTFRPVAKETETLFDAGRPLCMFPHCDELSMSILRSLLCSFSKGVERLACVPGVDSINGDLLTASGKEARLM